MATFNNIEAFDRWLSENMMTSYDLEAALEELERHAMETGHNHYEIPGYESKTGITVEYGFEVEHIPTVLDDDGEPLQWDMVINL